MGENKKYWTYSIDGSTFYDAIISLVNLKIIRNSDK